MTDTTLKTLSLTNGNTLRLNKNSEAMRMNDDIQKALDLSVNNSDKAIRTKEYRNGNIYRHHANLGQSYSSAVPKNGNGAFWILDNYNVLDSNLGGDKVSIGGKVRNGQIVEVNSGKLTSDTILNADKIKNILAKDSAKEINLQNLTKVYLNKVLKFLKK